MKRVIILKNILLKNITANNNPPEITRTFNIQIHRPTTHIHFDYAHFNTVFVKMRTFVSLNIRKIQTLMLIKQSPIVISCLIIHL